MRQANSAIVRKRLPITTVDEILHDLNGSTVFTNLDIKWAFHQVELSEESRPITTFVTHKGLFRYKKLMFGISCAPEMYQRVIQQALEGCEDVRNIYDDIIVHGKTAEQHDTRLEKAFGRIQEKGLPLNKEKCKFLVLRLQPYRFTARHIPGKVNIADTLFRLTDQHTKSCAKLCTETEDYVRFVAENAAPGALSTRETQRASAVDNEHENVGGPELFKCNYDIGHLNLSKCLPAFYHEIITFWQDVIASNPKSKNDVLEQIVWNNKFIKLSLSAYEQRFYLYARAVEFV